MTLFAPGEPELELKYITHNITISNILVYIYNSDGHSGNTRIECKGRRRYRTKNNNNNGALHEFTSRRSTCMYAPMHACVWLCVCPCVCVSPPEPGLKLLAFSLDSSSWLLPYHFRMHFSPPFYLLCFVIDFRHLTPKYTHTQRLLHTHMHTRTQYYAVHFMRFSTVAPTEQAKAAFYFH